MQLHPGGRHLIFMSKHLLAGLCLASGIFIALLAGCASAGQKLPDQPRQEQIQPYTPFPVIEGKAAQ
jgi:hypothetical protein